MPRATTCTLKGSPIGVEEAIRLNDEARRSGHTVPDFRCHDCGAGVRPHRDGGQAAAHFEHFERNAACPLSDPERS
jgi:hypothetical protein